MSPKRPLPTGRASVQFLAGPLKMIFRGPFGSSSFMNMLLLDGLRLAHSSTSMSFNIDPSPPRKKRREKERQRHRGANRIKLLGVQYMGTGYRGNGCYTLFGIAQLGMHFSMNTSCPQKEPRPGPSFPILIPMVCDSGYVRVYN
uniref:Uncharacterized protein n=1 Tax=Opuntia streptacantha TaxID=393608 RepID=A0A7C9E270_OPUST